MKIKQDGACNASEPRRSPVNVLGVAVIYQGPAEGEDTLPATGYHRNNMKMTPV